MFDVFLVNAIVYIFTLFFILYRYRTFNLYVVVWLFESFVAVAGVFLVNSGLHYSGSKTLGYHISPIPYICLYISNLIMTYPLKRVKPGRINFSDYCNSKFVSGLVYFSICLVIPLCILRGVEAYVMSTIGFGEAYAMAYEGESMFTYSNPILRLLSTWGSTYCNLFAPIIALFFISKLVKKKGNVTANMMGVALSFMPATMNALAKGSKGSLFFVAWDLLFFYILCSQLISKKAKRVIMYTGVLALTLLVIWSAAIQGGRIETKKKNSTVEEIFFQYLGESMPNIGWEVYDKVKWHPNGRRFYPEFFEGKGDKSKLSHEDWHYYWSSKIGVRVEKFHTFWGDSYMEFGLPLSLLYVLAVAFLWDKLVFQYSNNISWIPLVSYYYKIFIIWGVFGHGGFSGSRSHIMFLYLVVICTVINGLNKRKKELRYMP